ncbi:hypothetical protein EYM_00660 [Ignicoccus islandicus DSM 13165]|uniref:Ribosomal RNA adenine methylase transferase N-terminal domain-containing protein n=1 Tax=Ignicoccus islandicus DSM 13165 TaxID=940295 RepID=A0A0U2WME8_9CREN|nr:16S rRNA (adenine(1518)-N(6)/adenine(1519)-N(6))-dimethyltransferase RsmA [Ignicoccus islandicus]ALU12129.1 hypothetical protein EYM_00660 [Ignicoccus islandicus DSM 13165]
MRDLVLSEIGKLSFRPKKWLGQNFTVDRRIIDYFVSNIERSTEVIEIGTGLGTLTLALAEISKRVITIERDERLCNYLKRKLEKVSNVTLICGDALEYPFNKPWVVGSIPYSISGPLLAKLSTSSTWEKSLLLLQKDFVDRITARPGSKDYGRLSVMVQLCCEIEKGPVWPPNSFWPRPQVLSQHVHLKRLESVPEEFSKFLACLFSQKNKKLRKVARSCGFEWDDDRRVREVEPKEFLRVFERVWKSIDLIGP